MIKQVGPTFADIICDLRTRKIKQTFFEQINPLFDWASIKDYIEVDYKKGQSVTGKSSYNRSTSNYSKNRSNYR